MRILEGPKEIEAQRWMEEARRVALEATCKRARCGTVIVGKGKIIGRGCNSPPGGLESQRRCTCDKKSYHPRVTDKTCCIHAEQRAIDQALRDNQFDLLSSTLYFIRINGNGESTHAGNPYCTICSKRALDVGVEKFVLWRPEGICVYTTEEYNDLSFSYEG
jgi:deoxycytidylate deaminase